MTDTDTRRLAEQDTIAIKCAAAWEAAYECANPVLDANIAWGHVRNLLAIIDRITQPTSTAGADAPITAAYINALPPRLRSYIHDIETKCDPTGDIQTIHSQRDQIAGLVARIRELEASPVTTAPAVDGGGE